MGYPRRCRSLLGGRNDNRDDIGARNDPLDINRHVLKGEDSVDEAANLD